MGAKAGVKMMPIRWNADRGVLEVPARKRIKRPSQPVAKEDGAKSDPLIARRPKGQQEKKGIAQADLGERVFKGEVGLGAVERAEEDAEYDQQQGAPDGVRQHLGKCRAFSLPASNGIRESHAH